MRSKCPRCGRVIETDCTLSSRGREAWLFNCPVHGPWTEPVSYVRARECAADEVDESGKPVKPE